MSQQKERKVVYPKIIGKLMKGDKALSDTVAADLLGWVSETESNKPFGTDYLFKDTEGVKIRCLNNSCPPIYVNRPLYYTSNVIPIKQEILRKKWKFNFEPITIGRTGLVLNGQHQLIALRLACQEWRRFPEKYPEWDTEPTIDKFVGFGVDEDDETVNTMDTAKPRVLQDVLFRSEHFSECRVKDRRRISRIASFAIKTVWKHMGISVHTSQTHSESLDFLYRHPTLLDCIHLIFEEDGGEHLKNFVTPGVAAGLMFLMASSGSDLDAYEKHPCDESLDWSNRDRAETFFTLLCNRAEEFEPIFEELASQIQDLRDTKAERKTLICQSWLAYLAQGRVNRSRIRINYDDSTGINRPIVPNLGGLDVL